MLIHQFIFFAKYSHVIALDGLSYKQIWNTTFAGSESYSTIGVGYYDRDYVPDFIVKYLHGPGYPVYEYEQTVVLSGKGAIKFSLVAIFCNIFLFHHLYKPF